MYVHTFLVVVILNANEFVEKVGGVQNLFFIISREHHGYWIHNRLVVNDL